jgi:hypothetical protein
MFSDGRFYPYQYVTGMEKKQKNKTKQKEKKKPPKYQD